MPLMYRIDTPNACIHEICSRRARSERRVELGHGKHNDPAGGRPAGSQESDFRIGVSVYTKQVDPSHFFSTSDFLSTTNLTGPFTG